MIFENVDHSIGMYHAIRGMRNSWNSWDKSDTGSKAIADLGIIGPEDLALCRKLVKAGPAHRKFMRMIFVYADITAPLHWWKQFDTYKVGTVANSTSTMHTVMKKPFDISDFGFYDSLVREEETDPETKEAITGVINALNLLRARSVIEPGKKRVFESLIFKLLPSSYMQKRTVCISYEVLYNIWTTRRGHKLPEWQEFIDILCKCTSFYQFVEGMDDEET